MAKRPYPGYATKYAPVYKRFRPAPTPAMAPVPFRRRGYSSRTRPTETKYITQSTDTQSVDYSGTIFSLAYPVTRGDNFINNFEGSTIYPKGLTIRYQWSSDQSYTKMRIIVFQWKDSTLPTMALCLASFGSSLAPLSGTTLASKPVMKVLYDSLETGSYPTAGTSYTEAHKLYISGYRMLPVKYQATSDNIRTNGIYMLVISDDGAVNYPQFSYYSTLSFTD